jgi:hypothetical protein
MRAVNNIWWVVLSILKCKLRFGGVTLCVSSLKKRASNQYGSPKLLTKSRLGPN